MCIDLSLKNTLDKIARCLSVWEQKKPAGIKLQYFCQYGDRKKPNQRTKLSIYILNTIESESTTWIKNRSYDDVRLISRCFDDRCTTNRYPGPVARSSLQSILFFDNSLENHILMKMWITSFDVHKFSMTFNRQVALKKLDITFVNCFFLIQCYFQDFHCTCMHLKTDVLQHIMACIITSCKISVEYTIVVLIANLNSFSEYNLLGSVMQVEPSNSRRGWVGHFFLSNMDVAYKKIDLQSKEESLLPWYSQNPRWLPLPSTKTSKTICNLHS